MCGPKDYQTIDEAMTEARPADDGWHKTSADDYIDAAQPVAPFKKTDVAEALRNDILDMMTRGG